MSKKKTIYEINEKLKNGQALVLTAEEVSKMATELSPSEIVDKVDVVTTATFGPMCSSGVFINFGHSEPPIRMQKVLLNDVEAYAGVAAVDAYLGATQLSKSKPGYGGAHVIEELIAGRDIRLEAVSNGTDCYPRKKISTLINRESINEFFMFNPRNAYQNYPAATNSSDETIYTYMGVLKPRLSNVNYSTSGELSPLLNDPELRTIGIGSRIFLCGAQGFVTWNGTQFRTKGETNKSGIPLNHDATIAVIGDCKQMDNRYIKAAYYNGYGVSLFVGIGIPIPVLDEDIAYRVSIKNSEIETKIRDYSQPGKPEIARANYETLQSGRVIVDGREIRTSSMSSLKRAREIADTLKQSIIDGKFEMTQMVQALPADASVKPLTVRN